MNSATLSALSIEIILVIFLTFFIFFLALQVYLLRKKFSHFMKGASGESFEEIVKETLEKVKALEIYAEKSSEKIKMLQSKEKELLVRPELLRYKALEGASSNQSFSLAFLNNIGDGVVLTTLHVRDRVGFYAKKIINFKADVDLSEEEKDVIEKIKNRK